MPQGEGKEEWEDGSVYKGCYSDGCKSGYGEFKFANGAKYLGHFKDDIFNGRGQLVKPDQTNYEGEWRDGDLTSPAKIKYPNGNVFEGEVINLIQDGTGVLFDHGVQFIGRWVNGKLEGDVVLKNTDGSEKKASYKEGKFVAWLSNTDGTPGSMIMRETIANERRGLFSCCKKWE